MHLNPQFSLELQAPTSLSLTLKQLPAAEGAPASAHAAALYIVSRSAENDVRLDLAHYEALAEQRAVQHEERLDRAIATAAREREVNSQAQIADFGATFRLPARGQAAVDLILQSPSLRSPGASSPAPRPARSASRAASATLFKAASSPGGALASGGGGGGEGGGSGGVTGGGGDAAAAAASFGARSLRDEAIAHSALGRESGASCSPWDAGAEAPLLAFTDGRVYGLTSSNVAATSGAPSSADLRVFASLQPGRYTVLCATQDKGAEGAFGLSIQATSSVSVTQLWPPTVSEGAISAAREFPETRRAEDVDEDEDEDVGDAAGGAAGGSGGGLRARGGGGLFAAAVAAAGRRIAAASRLVVRAQRALGLGDGHSSDMIESLKTHEATDFVRASNAYARAQDAALAAARAAFTRTGVPRTKEGTLLFDHRVFAASDGSAPEVDVISVAPEAAAAEAPAAPAAALGSLAAAPEVPDDTLVEEEEEEEGEDEWDVDEEAEGQGEGRSP